MSILVTMAFLAVLTVNYQWVPTALAALALVLFSRDPDGSIRLHRFLFLLFILLGSIALAPSVGAWL